jgi:hypothetical protein
LTFVVLLVIGVVVRVTEGQPDCLNCINGVCTLAGKCECNSGFVRRNNNCLEDDGSMTSAASDILPGLPNAILFGLIAGGVLLIVIMVFCCVYFMRSSLNDAPKPTSASYRDNAIRAQNIKSGATFNANASGATFGGGNIFGGSFSPASGAGGSAAAAPGFLSHNESMATFNPSTATQHQQQPQRSATVTAMMSSGGGGGGSGSARGDLRESVHTGFAFPGALNDDDDDELVKSEDMLPDAGSPALYAAQPNKSTTKKKKPVHSCSECGAEYYWETDLAAHRKKRHNIVD